MKTKRAKSVEGWAIKQPGHGLQLSTISATEAGSIRSITEWTIPSKWDGLYLKGFRCVRVTISEVTK